jgi:hypothetical protein
MALAAIHNIQTALPGAKMPGPLAGGTGQRTKDNDECSQSAIAPQ